MFIYAEIVRLRGAEPPEHASTRTNQAKRANFGDVRNSITTLKLFDELDSAHYAVARNVFNDFADLNYLL